MSFPSGSPGTRTGAQPGALKPVAHVAIAKKPSPAPPAKQPPAASEERQRTILTAGSQSPPQRRCSDAFQGSNSSCSPLGALLAAQRGTPVAAPAPGSPGAPRSSTRTSLDSTNAGPRASFPLAAPAPAAAAASPTPQATATTTNSASSRSSSSDGALPQLLQLLPPALAAAHIAARLQQRDRRHLALSCKAGHAIAAASLASLTLSEPAAPFSTLLLKTQFPGCSAARLRPHSMEALSNLLSKVLLVRPKPLPNLTSLQLELQGLYAKQCDLSLTLKSIAVHVPALTHLHIDQPAPYTAREAAAVGEMQQLTQLELLSTMGFEPGALGHLTRLRRLTRLHLQLSTAGLSAPPSPALLSQAASGSASSSSPPSSSSSSSLVASLRAASHQQRRSSNGSYGGGGGSSGTGRGNSSGGGNSSSAALAAELGRMTIADAAALQQLQGLASLSISGMPPPLPAARAPGSSTSSSSSTWTVEALLQAAARAAVVVAAARAAEVPVALPPGQPGCCQQLQHLSITDCGIILPSMVEVVAGISSLVDLTLREVSDPSSIALLAGLQQLEALAVAPLQPTAAALEALAAGPAGSRLRRLMLGALPGQSLGCSFPALEELQLINGATAGSSGQTLTSSSSSSSSMIGMKRITVGLTGLARAFPWLKVLGVAGWQLDAAGVEAVLQLRQLHTLLLHGRGGSQPAGVLLPLLAMPGLQQVQLLGLAGLTDDWVGDAVKRVGGQGGTFQAIRHLALGAVQPASEGTQLLTLPSSSTSGKGASSGSSGSQLSPSGSASSSSSAVAMSAALAAAAAAAANGSSHLTDRGLVRLFVCPRLQKLELVNLNGITLAGVKALARGCPTLQQMVIMGSPAVAAAPPEAVARAGLCGEGRVVDVLVS